MNRSISEGRIRSNSAVLRRADAGAVNFHLAEVAVLNYLDGTVRLMTASEALVQMKNASKLPREFWQHIRTLQTPVHSVQVGMPTRYIAYSFDARNAAVDPQKPVPLSHVRQSFIAHVEHKRQELQSKRVSAVPQKINEWLAGRRKGQSGFGLQLIS